jgi:hypothetical protein
MPALLDANFSETLNGIQTIRAYGAEHRMNRKNARVVDNNQVIFILLMSLLYCVDVCVLCCVCM